MNRYANVNAIRLGVLNVISFTLLLVQGSADRNSHGRQDRSKADASYVAVLVVSRLLVSHQSCFLEMSHLRQTANRYL